MRNELHGYLDDGEGELSEADVIITVHAQLPAFAVDGLYSGTGGLTRTFPREGKPVPSERMPVDPRSCTAGSHYFTCASSCNRAKVVFTVTMVILL